MFVNFSGQCPRSLRKEQKPLTIIVPSCIYAYIYTEANSMYRQGMHDMPWGILYTSCRESCAFSKSRWRVQGERQEQNHSAITPCWRTKAMWILPAILFNPIFLVMSTQNFLCINILFILFLLFLVYNSFSWFLSYFSSSFLSNHSLFFQFASIPTFVK